LSNHKCNKKQTGFLKLRNSIDTAKIIKMEPKEIHQTFIANEDTLHVAERLLSQGWRKGKGLFFYKERNSYKIELDGLNHPLWDIKVKPKNEGFHIKDWKLKKDLRDLKYRTKPLERRLYVNERDRQQLASMMTVMKQRNLALIYNENFIVFRSAMDGYRIFKIAAAMSLVEQKDGWYIGQKRVI